MKKIAYIIISLLTPLLLTGSALAATPPKTEQLRPFMFRHSLNTKLKGVSQVAAENWSGYAASGANGSYSSVSSTWTQPTVNCTGTIGRSSYSAYWVGLDGFNDQTVEQIGSEANCINNKAQYYAWYEMYPQEASEALVGLTIVPGNHLTATVTYVPSSSSSHSFRDRFYNPASFSLTISDTTTGRSFTTTQQAEGQANRSSAEVITEAPSSSSILPLADFGTVNYTASLVNGAALGASPNLQDIIMQNPAGMVSTPSAFDVSNKNFSVTWSNS